MGEYKNSSDARYAALLKSIHDADLRRKANELAKQTNKTEHWYFIAENYCPICGDTEIFRERMYTLRPEDWEERHEIRESYDGCEGY